MSTCKLSILSGYIRKKIKYLRPKSNSFLKMSNLSPTKSKIFYFIFSAYFLRWVIHTNDVFKNMFSKCSQPLGKTGKRIKITFWMTVIKRTIITVITSLKSSEMLCSLLALDIKTWAQIILYPFQGNFVNITRKWSLHIYQNISFSFCLSFIYNISNVLFITQWNWLFQIPKNTMKNRSDVMFN